MEFTLSANFLGDLVMAFAFGLLAILLIVIGFKAVDWLTPRCDFEEEVAKGNIAASILVSAIILGLCHVVVNVVSRILVASVQ